MKPVKNVLWVRLCGFAALIAAITIGFTTLSLTGCGDGGGGGEPEVISIKAIPGVTVPATGAIPVGVITETAQYKGTVSWKNTRDGSSNIETFAAKTAYTATITLTAKDGFTLLGVTANFFTVAGATATNAVNSGVITAVFSSTGGTADDPTEIDLKAIPGVTIPVTGATPAAAITETAQYTGTVSWNPNVDTFAAETAYTATITLTAKTGYTLEGVTENFFTVAGATASNAVNSGVITAVFPATTGGTSQSNGISLSKTDTHTFTSATFDYSTAPAALTVTVTNTNNQATGALTVALGGTNASNFTLSKTSISSIAASGTDTFTVAPKTGLSVGTYTAEVTVSGGNGITAGFNVSFTVNLANFTGAPAFNLVTDNATITCFIVQSDMKPTPADSYDVYWKAGSGLSAADVKSGTKITGAGGYENITGLTNDTWYSVIVTANKAGYTSVDSAVSTAMPSVTYIITGSGAEYTATKSGSIIGEENKPIQDVINAIKANIRYSDRTIQFGDGSTVLDIGTESVSFNDIGMGNVITLTGKISSANNTAGAGTIVLDNSSLSINADITNTASGGNAVYNTNNSIIKISGGTVSATTGKAVYNDSTGAVTISGGTVSATTGVAVYNASTGKITVSGTAMVTSANTTSTQGTIYLANSGTTAATRLEISGGTVRNTANNADASAVFNVSTGAVTISGGTVSATQGVAIRSTSTSDGTITVSGTAKVTSVNRDTSSGTIYITGANTADRLVIEGGTVENTSGRAVYIYNSTNAKVKISGGTVSATTGAAVYAYFSTGAAVTISGGTVSATTGNAVHTNLGSTAVTISGGTVSATTGVAVYSNSTGKITVSGTAKVTSANITDNRGTIYLANQGSTTATRLEISGGTVENTANDANARTVYNDSDYCRVEITGGTVSATMGAAVYDAKSSTINISGGTVSATTGIAVYAGSSSTSGKITVSGTAKITSANTTATQGTIYLQNNNNSTLRLEIQSGTIENTASGGYAIYNDSGVTSGSVPDTRQVTISTSATITGLQKNCPSPS